MRLPPHSDIEKIKSTGATYMAASGKPKVKSTFSFLSLLSFSTETSLPLLNRRKTNTLTLTRIKKEEKNTQIGLCMFYRADGEHVRFSRFSSCHRHGRLCDATVYQNRRS